MNTSTTCREQTVAMVLKMGSHVVIWPWTFVTLAIVSVRTARRRLHLSMASLRLAKAPSTLTKGESSSFLSLRNVYIYIEIPIFSQYFFATTDISQPPGGSTMTFWDPSRQANLSLATRIHSRARKAAPIPSRSKVVPIFVPTPEDRDNPNHPSRTLSPTITTSRQSSSITFAPPIQKCDIRSPQ